MDFASITIGHTILLKPQLFCKSARTSPALGWSYMGNFALNSSFNGKKHGQEAEEHKSCKFLFHKQPESALNEDTVHCWWLHSGHADCSTPSLARVSLEERKGLTSCSSSFNFGLGFISSNGQVLCCFVIESFCPDKTFHFVCFTIFFGHRPTLTSSGHRIPFRTPLCRLRPLGNMRRLNSPADSTLKWGLLASCRDRCYSSLIYTCPHLFVLKIPFTESFTNTEGTG